MLRKTLNIFTKVLLDLVCRSLPLPLVDKESQLIILNPISHGGGIIDHSSLVNIEHLRLSLCQNILVLPVRGRKMREGNWFFAPFLACDWWSFCGKI